MRACVLPAAPALKAIWKIPKFLLLSSAPASCGFMAEPVGTRQGSPLRCDERAKNARPSMRSRIYVNHFSFFAGKKISVCCAGSVKGAVFHAAQRTLDGFCATRYTTSASKKETASAAPFHCRIAIRQPAFHPHSGMDSYMVRCTLTYWRVLLP
jgi:hypothetical protein